MQAERRPVGASTNEPPTMVPTSLSAPLRNSRESDQVDFSNFSKISQTLMNLMNLLNL